MWYISRWFYQRWKLLWIIIIYICGNEILIQEYKASSTAPLTKNQKKAHPEIEKSGGIVVGKGKPPFIGGMEIPPTKVKIVRKK
mgnify:CR=1 FL=1